MPRGSLESRIGILQLIGIKAMKYVVYVYEAYVLYDAYVCGCINLVHVYILSRLRGENSDDLMAGNEGEKINTEIRENISHRPVGFCRATNHFSWNPREEQRCRQHSCFHLPVHLDMGNKGDTMNRLADLYSRIKLPHIVTTIQHVNSITVCTSVYSALHVHF